MINKQAMDYRDYEAKQRSKNYLVSLITTAFISAVVIKFIMYLGRIT